VTCSQLDCLHILNGRGEEFETVVTVQRKNVIAALAINLVGRPENRSCKNGIVAAAREHVIRAALRNVDLVVGVRRARVVVEPVRRSAAVSSHMNEIGFLRAYDHGGGALVGNGRALYTGL